MDYESISNFNINKSVASLHLDGFECIDNKVVGYLRRAGFLNVSAVFDPCRNPLDAWPFIIENKITIINLGDEYIATHGFQLRDDESCDNIADWSLEARDKNPLRAAMIVFLMMQDNLK